MFKNKAFFLGILSIFVIKPIQSATYWNWQAKDTHTISFPSNFRFGTSVFAGEIIANNHSNLYKKDIQLAKEIGLTEWCFSIDWPKVEPHAGKFDDNMLQYYADYCDELNKNGIQPLIILKDYNDPSWFISMGGFEKEKNIAIFERYCLKMFEVLKGKAYRFIIFWTPESYAMLGYWNKSIPPFKHNLQLAMKVLRNELEAYVRVYQKLKMADDEKKIQLGITKQVLHLEPYHIWDKLSCSMAHMIVNKSIYKFFTHGSFDVSVPLLPGKWGGARMHYKNKLAPSSIDFIGINYHSHTRMKNLKLVPFKQDEKTEIESFTVYPEGLYYAIKDVSDNIASKLNIPIIITYQGIATNDDSLRIRHNERSLYAITEAIAHGYNVQAYYYYSLIDGFTWGGYDKHFGLFSVDRTTFKRTIRQGASRFIEIAQNHKKMCYKE